MADDWVLQEMAAVDLHDKRLEQRLSTVLSQLASQPRASIPAACGGHAEMTAAYRMLDNDAVTWDGILAPHAAAARQRIAAQPVVLLAQDTTEIDVTRPHQQVAGAGPLDGANRRGALLHLMHAFTPDGTPLGTLDSQAWVRADGPTNAAVTRAERAALPLADKESQRWVTTLEHAQAEAEHCPQTQLICVADSEADIYEFMATGTRASSRIDWIVRACQDRALQMEAAAGAAPRLRERLLEQPVLLTQAITVRGRDAKVQCDTRRRRQPRVSREAQVAVRAATVTLRPPYRASGKLPAITVNAVLASELDPPADDVAVEWLLLTSLPVDDAAQAQQVLDYYCGRWMIEVFFRVLKSGCRVEERRFEQMDRLLNCLAVYLIVAWRTLYVCRLGRSCPEADCELLFEPAEWKSVWRITKRAAPPAAPPKLGEMVRLVAQLGGYVGGKNRLPPGPQTVWIGLQ
ncbi:MAG TPA: IS4 family transposase, partial [Firmicutes bacterium]|nr:IS4 family transposase [Bacillota bacterium]